MASIGTVRFAACCPIYANDIICSVCARRVDVHISGDPWCWWRSVGMQWCFGLCVYSVLNMRPGVIKRRYKLLCL